MIGRSKTWKWWRELARAGQPPTNVRILAGDGEQSVSCVYDGYVNGCDYWRAILPDTAGDVFGLLVDELPRHTAIVLVRD